jgi:hypothetical protein
MLKNYHSICRLVKFPARYIVAEIEHLPHFDFKGAGEFAVKGQKDAQA